MDVAVFYYLNYILRFFIFNYLHVLLHFESEQTCNTPVKKQWYGCV